MSTTVKLTNTSLFDYLGRAAGSKLGLAVAKAAKTLKQPHTVRHVETPAYTGPINEYTMSFLDTYFNDPKNKTIINEDKKDHEKKKQTRLPF